MDQFSLELLIKRHRASGITYMLLNIFCHVLQLKCQPRLGHNLFFELLSAQPQLLCL